MRRTATPSHGAAILVVALLLAGIVWAVRPSLRTMIGFHSKSGQVPPLARCLRRLAVPERPPWSGICRGRGLRSVPPGDREGLPLAPDGPIAAPVGGRDEDPPAGTAPGLPLEGRRLLYTIERRDGRVFHKATQRG